jgi:hypothetical protein
MQRIRSDRDEPPEDTSTGRGIGRRDAVPPDGEKSIWGPLLASLSLKTDGVSYLREPPISSR